MIVSETFAARMFGRENPIGKRAMSSRDEKVEREIVGVVRDVKLSGAADSARALVWVPYAQNNAWSVGIITVRTRDNPAGALAAVKRELRSLDGGIALANVGTMDQAMARSMAGNRLIAFSWERSPDSRSCSRQSGSSEFSHTRWRSGTASLAFAWRSERSAPTYFALSRARPCPWSRVA
jgi:hypothetical protein